MMIDGRTLNTNDFAGTSSLCPQVCGSDMMTYPTACHLYKKACETHRMMFAVSTGPCDMSKFLSFCHEISYIKLLVDNFLLCSGTE